MRTVLKSAALLAGCLNTGILLADYNMPEAKTGEAVEAALEVMEKAVSPEALESFMKANPADFWLFGEDRSRSVRSWILPGHWFEAGAPHHGKFRGKAQPGENYVFQVAVLNGKNPLTIGLPEVKLPADSPLKVTCLSLDQMLPSGESRTINRTLEAKGALEPLWFCVEIPEKADSSYAFQLIVNGKPFDVRIDVAGEIVEKGGVREGARLARLKWLNSRIAHSDTEITAPFTPIRVDTSARAIEILGRRITLAQTGIPADYQSFFNAANTKILSEGRPAFVVPPEFTVGNQAWQPESFAFTKTTPVTVAWKGVNRSPDGRTRLMVDGLMEYDGFMALNLTLEALEDISIEKAALTFTLSPETSTYSMGMGMRGGKAPESFQWSWDVAKHQDALWIGGINQGIMIRLKGGNYERPLINAYYDFKPLLLPESWGSGGASFTRSSTGTALSLYSGVLSLKAGETRHFNSDWYFTPFKPIVPSVHFTDRYYHSNQGRGLENLDDLKKNGVTMINIHHNRLTNPFINYPYNDLSIQRLKDQVKAVHARDILLKVYYTTREITQNLPEFFALYSMKGEVVMPRKEGVAWPVTNKNGPHPWLKAHLEDNFVPAWRETLRYPEYKGMLDLAVITTPDTRWNNFYLEGLNFLIDEVGIDGLYIDDTALDRKSMQRARRILDKDGPGKRKVDMHSWSHYNGLAKWANSSICFMELYPYYDRLWHGEGFSFDSSPDFILIEMSGIPFGLMSEMLHHGGNPWRGMLFGMTRRWPWSGDPRPVWKIIDAFGVEPGIEISGFWLNDTPVKSSSADIPATVYRKPGKAMIALASWAKEKQDVTLEIDWKALGLSPESSVIRAIESAGFQPGRIFRPDEPIPVEPKKGWLLLIEPKP